MKKVNKRVRGGFDEWTNEYGHTKKQMDGRVSE
jgi:hypothetical protein